MTREILLPKKSITPPKGITAKSEMAAVMLIMGAITKRVWSARAGITSSLKKALIPSAMGWNRPKGPTRLGPYRTWIRPKILRSARVR